MSEPIQDLLFPEKFGTGILFVSLRESPGSLRFVESLRGATQDAGPYAFARDIGELLNRYF